MEVDELQNREGDKNNEINNLYNRDYVYLFLVYLLFISWWSLGYDLRLFFKGSYCGNGWDD